MSVQVIPLEPTKCSVTNCTNHAGEGRMVELIWARGMHGIENRLILCGPCLGTLSAEWVSTRGWP